jgi:hypothetical protein
MAVAQPVTALELGASGGEAGLVSCMTGEDVIHTQAQAGAHMAGVTSFACVLRLESPDWTAQVRCVVSGAGSCDGKASS